MKKFVAVFLAFSLALSFAPTVFAWNMPNDAPPVINDPAFQFPAFDNGEVVLNKVIGRLPALGWNSWNAFSSSITEARIKSIADAFIYRGLDKVGYEYVVIDDGCYPTQRVDGRITNNANFASGFKAMSDYVHGLGLKFGMYNDVGRVTCANQAGLYGYEDIDAQSYAEWDIDYIKVDYCGFPWDIGYRSAVAPNQQYVFAPRIRSVTFSGGGLAQPFTLNAVADGIHINNPEVSESGNYVGRIGTDLSKYDNQIRQNQMMDEPFWRELGFNVNVPADGEYDMVVNYATGNPARYSDETSQAVASTTVRIGRWLQVAVGPQENEARYFDNGLPQTDFGTTQTYTFMDSPVIKVKLKAGDNLLRMMNHRREETALYAYAAFLDGLNKAGVGDKIILSVCDWGQCRPYHWAYKVGDSWRSSDDITLSQNANGGSAQWGSITASPTAGNTNSIMGQYNKNVVLWQYSGLTRGWNDPDMMVIGMNNINATMAKSHMALWCMMNSPIMLGFDLTNDTKWEANKDVVLNTDFLAMNQDPLGIQCKRVYSSLATTNDISLEYLTNTNRIDIVAKPLVNGDVALTFINCGSTAAHGSKSASVDADTIIKYIGGVMADGNGKSFKNADEYIIKDLWTKEITYNTTGVFSVTDLGITDSLTIRITPKSGPVVTDAEATPYKNNSSTFVSGAVDVFISPEAGTTYYYLIGESQRKLEVYYNGETGNPVGSYFDGSLVNGSLVITMGETLDFVSGIPVSGNRITVPAASPGESTVLKVIAYKDNVASPVFTHEFRCVEPTSVLYQAVYRANGLLVSVATIGFKPPGVMDVDLDTYPLGEYFTKVFCWDENYVPLFDAITFK